MIPLLGAPPIIDGSLTEWADVAPLPIDHALWRRSTAQASARVAVSGQTLYLAVVVTGDVYVPGEGIAGDHVELWLGEPGALREEAGVRAQLTPEQLAESEETEVGRARRLAAADVDPPVQHLIVSADGHSLRETPTVETVVVQAVTRAEGDGWVAEVAVPLSLLPRTTSLTLDALALRVDLVDADGARPQDALLSTAPLRAWAATPTLRLSAPVVLQEDLVWGALGITPALWLPTAEGWTAAERTYDWIGMSPVQGQPVVRPLPPVSVIDGPLTVRVVDSRIDRREGAGWTPWLGSLGQPSAAASWHGPFLLTELEENDRGIPGPGMCGAASTTTWTLWRIDSGEPVALLEDSSDTCMDGHTCELEGGDFTCTASEGPDGAMPARCWTLDALHRTVSPVACPEEP